MKKYKVNWNIIKNMLMKNTGSTTVLLEAITLTKLKVKVLEQKCITDNCKVEWNGSTIRRETILSAKGIGVSHKVSYIDWEELKSNVQDDLKKGILPIGKILMEKDYRRKILYTGSLREEEQQFLNIREKPDGISLRKYEIWVGESCLFLIYELFYEENLVNFLEGERVEE